MGKAKIVRVGGHVFKVELVTRGKLTEQGRTKRRRKAKRKAPRRSRRRRARR